MNKGQNWLILTTRRSLVDNNRLRSRNLLCKRFFYLYLLKLIAHVASPIAFIFANSPIDKAFICIHEIVLRFYDSK